MQLDHSKALSVTVAWLVDVGRFNELHEWLGFMSQVLIWITLFLAPGYAWLSVVRRGAVLSLPNLVRCTLKFILRRLKKGARTYPAGLSAKDFGDPGRSFVRMLLVMTTAPSWKLVPTPRRFPWHGALIPAHLRLR